MRGRVPLSLVILLAFLFLTHRSASGEIGLFLEYDYLNSTSESTDRDTGEVTETDFNRFVQLYNLNISRNIYPNLNFRGGGIFELENSDINTDGEKFERERRTSRPFIELNLNTPLIKLGGGYRKTEIKRTLTAAPTEKDFVDEYNANLNWRPLDFPQVSVNYTHTNFYDSAQTTDVVNDLLSTDTRYEYKDIGLQYLYTRNDTEDRKSDFNTLTQSHTGKLNYSKSFFDRRLGINADYRLNYTTTDFSGAGSGTFPLSRSEGLFSPDDDEGLALESRPALIDGNVVSSSGIDIGLGGDETKRISMGIDFGVPMTVDTLFVWVDRRLSATVANSFVWEVYTSPDNTDTSIWTLRAIVSPAFFGSFNNRFEISFPEVQTRFIKVVTRPLAIADAPDAADFPNIFVTELEGLISVQGAADEQLTSIDNSFNFRARWTITPRTSLGYTFFYRDSKTDPGEITRTTLSNGLDLTHTFSQVFTGTVRVLRSDSKRGLIETTENAYSASLRATYLPTLSQTLTLSVSRQKEDGSKARANSVFLRTNAELYSGWSAFFDAGYTWGTSFEGVDSTITFLRAGTNLVPHRRFTLDTSYTASWSKEADEPTSLRQTGGVQIFFLPFDTLSLSANVSFSDEEDDSRVFQNYSVNWSPFPEGTLQLSILYNETLSTEGQESRSVGPRVIWRLTQRAELTVIYTVVDTESESTLTDSKNFSANLRIAL